MYYVYFPKSVKHDFYYIGQTKDLKKRFKEHNDGLLQSTKHYAPFKLISYLAVNTRKQAEELEKYFKGGSGFAFARKRIFLIKKDSS
ncbi:MAG: GIY-YIG nuclease family protein [Candidatus Marinimicrobia bacterium]|nr:GIY-YIG nuclease family protein [Candidatus Neomarinimicrobiota bacterium]